jgi:hypothetical protein
MAPQQQQSAPKQGTNLIEAEIQHNIPVQPHSADNKNPITAPTQFVEHNGNNEAGLDEVLKDVNNSVKEEEKKPEKKSIFKFLKKKNTKKPDAPQAPAPLAAAPVSAPAPSANSTPENISQPQTPSAKPNSTKNPKPLIIGVVALAVTLGLVMAAFSAFKQPKDVAANKASKQISTSSAAQSAAPAKLTQEDVKDFSSNIQSNFANLNDSKDFNQSDLSDASLGL